jgi:two-component system, NarL family, nitrate/nitrite response regulator NarL
MPIRLVLADDHLLIHEALESLVQREPDFHIVARCQNGEETLHAVRQHRPDVLILELRIPGKSGLEVLRGMGQDKLPTRVVLLTTPLHGDELLEALLLGVEGVVLIERTSQQLVGCIRKVYAGDQWLDSSTVGGAVEILLQREVAARELSWGLRSKASVDSD